MWPFWHLCCCLFLCFFVEIYSCFHLAGRDHHQITQLLSVEKISGAQFFYYLFFYHGTNVFFFIIIYVKASYKNFFQFDFAYINDDDNDNDDDEMRLLVVVFEFEVAHSFFFFIYTITKTQEIMLEEREKEEATAFLFICNLFCWLSYIFYVLNIFMVVILYVFEPIWTYWKIHLRIWFLVFDQWVSYLQVKKERYFLVWEKMKWFL